MEFGMWMAESKGMEQILEFGSGNVEYRLNQKALSTVKSQISSTKIQINLNIQ